MKKLFLVLASMSAFALHETNCSNSDGSMKRVEKEVWGANPISFYLNGEKIFSKDYDITLDDSTKTTLLTRQIPNGVAETYSIEMTFTKLASDPSEGNTTVKDMVICTTWRNNFID